MGFLRHRVTGQGFVSLAAVTLLLLGAAALAADRAAHPNRMHNHFLAMLTLGSNSVSLDVITTLVHLSTQGHNVTILAPAQDMQMLEQFAARHAATEAATGHPVQANLTFITFNSPVGSFVQLLKKVLGSNMNKGSTTLKLIAIQHATSAPCGAVLHNDTLTEVLRSSGVDAVIEARLPIPGASDSCGCILSDLLDLPLIHVHGCALLQGPSSVPQFGSGLSTQDLNTWSGQLINHYHHKRRFIRSALIHVATWHLWHDLRTAAGLQDHTAPWKSRLARLASKMLPKPLSSLHAAKETTGSGGSRGSCSTAGGQSAAQGLDTGNSSKCSSSSSRSSGGSRCQAAVEVMFNSFVLEPPRPVEAHQVLVGPVSAHPARPISPPALADFLEGADPSYGVVLVAFGSSTLFGQMLTAQEVQQLALAFSDLAPTRVLWNIAAKGLPQGLAHEAFEGMLGNNTMLAPWVNYNDVLGHPACKLFVTHAGIHSSYEAAFHGVPVVTVPFQSEQLANALMLVGHGMGLLSCEAVAARGLPCPNTNTTSSSSSTGTSILSVWQQQQPRHFSREGMRSIMQQVLTNPAYKQAALPISRALQLHSNQRAPLDRAADAIELALVNKQRIRQEDVNASESYSLGVAGLAVAVVVLTAAWRRLALTR